MQKIFYLPEAHTDFILAVIGEELGLAGICGLLALYGMIGYAGLRTAKAAHGAYAKLLAAGLTSLILCQALLNIYAVLGLAPLTGVPLPFISSGSTSLIVLLCAMGLLLNVARRRLGAPARGARAAAGRGTDERPRIVIAAGGTAGHVVPAIAVADALRAEGAEVSSSAASAPRPSWCRPPATRSTRSASRASRARNPLKALRAIGKAALALRSAGRILRDRRRRRGARRRRLRRRAGRARRRAAAASRSCSPRPTRTSA